MDRSAISSLQTKARLASGHGRCSNGSGKSTTSVVDRANVATRLAQHACSCLKHFGAPNLLLKAARRRLWHSNRYTKPGIGIVLLNRKGVILSRKDLHVDRAYQRAG
jgi:hypothetical protein